MYKGGKWNCAYFVYALKVVGLDINNLFGGDAKAWRSTQAVV